MSEGVSTAAPAAAAPGAPARPLSRPRKHRAHVPDERLVSLASVVRGVVDRVYAALDSFLKQSVPPHPTPPHPTPPHNNTNTHCA